MKAVSLHPPSVMDPVGLSLAEVYAEALMGMLLDESRAEAVYDCLEKLNHLLDSIDQARQLLASPRINAEDRRRLVAEIFAGRLEEPLEGFLAVLSDHGRFDLLPAICQALRKQLNVRQGRQEVTLVTARILAESERKAIVDQLTEAMNCRLAVTVRVDPTLLGGMVVQLGDRVFDASLAGRVDQITARLKHRRWTDNQQEQPE